MTPDDERAATPDDRTSALRRRRSVDVGVASLLLLIALVARFVRLAEPVSDPDVWSHLAAGRWMTAHRTVPMVDPFLAGGEAHPWLNYAWSLDLLWWWGYRFCGLAAPVIYAALMSTALLFVCAALPRRDATQLVRRAFLAAVGFATISGCLVPRTFVATILLTGIVLLYVRECQRGGHPRRGFWLVPLFALWPNMHVEFIYGFFFLGLAIVDRLVESWRRTEPLGASFRVLCLVTFACAAATMLNPFGYELHKQVVRNVFMYDSWDLVIEMRASLFRTVDAYLLLAWLGAAVFTLARRRDASVYSWGCLLMSARMSFHSARAMWMIVFVALDIVGDLPLLQGADDSGRARWHRVVLPALAGPAVALFIAYVIRIRDRLVPTDLYPFAAAEYVRDHHLDGPMYNSYSWGAFLRFALPDVIGNIDGRGTTGPPALVKSTNTFAAKPGWRDDVELDRASFVLAEADSALSEILRLDKRFRVAFADPIAVVFLRERR